LCVWDIEEFSLLLANEHPLVGAWIYWHSENSMQYLDV
jgi:hypothetical protein